MKTFFLLLAFTLSSFAGTAIQSDSFKEIQKIINSKVKKYGKENVLVVLDIDNTTLTTTQNLGSDQWFGWQYSHCIGKKKSDICSTNDFNELLRIQGLLFAVIPMKPTDKFTKKVIKKAQNDGVKVIALTSRGFEFRNSTEISLKANGIHFDKSSIGPKGGFASTYKPYNLKNPTKFGLSTEDLKKTGNKKPRSVSFMNGVYMTAGLHKGIMLKTLLKKTGTNFKAIIFADDHEKHTKGMQLILGDDKNIDLTTVRYSKIDPIVDAFHKGDKKIVINAFNKMKMTLKELFGTF